MRKELATVKYIFIFLELFPLGKPEREVIL